MLHKADAMYFATWFLDVLKPAIKPYIPDEFNMFLFYSDKNDEFYSDKNDETIRLQISFEYDYVKEITFCELRWRKADGRLLATTELQNVIDYLKPCDAEPILWHLDLFSKSSIQIEELATYIDNSNESHLES